MNRGVPPEVVVFQEAAGEFCAAVETDHDVGWADAWVDRVLVSLAWLYACAHALPDLPRADREDDPIDAHHVDDVDDDEWRTVFARVHAVLGERAHYRAFYDPLAEDEPVVGDLGDDLADIHRDVAPPCGTGGQTPAPTSATWCSPGGASSTPTGASTRSAR